MKWEAKGAQRSDGVERSIVIDANDEAQARRRANRAGLLVEFVRMLDADDSGSPVAVSTRPIEPTIDYARPSTSASAARPVVASTEQTLQTIRPAFFTGQPGFIIVAFILIPVIAGIILLVMELIRCMTESITVTDRRVIHKTGFLFRKSSEVRIVDIRNVQMIQGPLQRIFGSGTLAASTAAKNEDEIKMLGVPGVVMVRGTIDGLRPHAG